jgi:hypothetical protein
MARRARLLSRFERPVLRRVDLRDGRPDLESSSVAPPLRPARIERLRAAVEPWPAFRRVALTPGIAVSTKTSRRGGAGRFAFFAPALC